MSHQFNCRERGKCYLANLVPQWGKWDHCFPGKITISDLDGIIERNGHLLICEWKSPRVPETTGQEIMAQRLQMRGDAYIVIWGDPKDSLVMELKFYLPGGNVKTYRPATDDLLANCFKAWNQWVDKQDHDPESIRQWQHDYALRCQELYGDDVSKWLTKDIKQ